MGQGTDWSRLLLQHFEPRQEPDVSHSGIFLWFPLNKDWSGWFIYGISFSFRGYKNADLGIEAQVTRQGVGRYFCQ